MIETKIIKHKARMPWERDPDAVASSAKMEVQGGFDDKHYKSHNEASAFAWMVHWSLRDGNKFNLDHTVNYWWIRAYTNKSFPVEGGLAVDLIDRVYCRLIDKGHDSVGIDPTESDYNLPGHIIRSEYWNKAGQKYINYISQLKEAEMAKVAKKSAPTKAGKTVEEVLEKPAKKTSAKSAPKSSSKSAPKSEFEPGIPAWITKSKAGTKAHESKVKVCELLLEQQYSDDEICLMVETELEYKMTPDRVSFYRKTLNKGQFAPLGFEAPEPSIEEIGDSSVTKPIAPPKKSKAIAEAAPVGKSAKVAPAKKTAGKKLVIKKK